MEFGKTAQTIIDVGIVVGFCADLIRASRAYFGQPS